MRVMLDLIDEPEILPLAFVIGIVTFLGSRLVEGQPRLHAWGLRIAFVVLVAYGVYGYQAFAPSSAADFTGLVIRCLLAAGLSLGIAWMALATSFFVLDNLRRYGVGPLLRCKEHWRRKRELERARAVEDMKRTELERTRQQAERERERNAPIEEAKRQASLEAQRRREDSRARVELAYNQHAPEISKRFSRKTLADFVARYMNDQQLPEIVEGRAQQVIAIMEGHLQKTGQNGKQSLADLAGWFLTEKQKLDELMISDEEKESILAGLEARFAQLQERHIRNMQP